MEVANAVGCGGRSFRLSPKIGASAVSPQVRFAPARRAGGRGEHSLFGTGSVTGVAHGAFLADQQSGNDGHSSREVKGAEEISKGAGTITICPARNYEAAMVLKIGFSSLCAGIREISKSPVLFIKLE